MLPPPRTAPPSLLDIILRDTDMEKKLDGEPRSFLAAGTK
jgi:hypothetical protein